MKQKAQLKIQVHKNPLRFLVPESSNAQLKIQEMAFMLVGVVLFFILAGLFALSIFSSHLNKSATQSYEERTYTAVVGLADSAELSCGARKSNCIDVDKVVALTKESNSKKYEKYWPFTKLVIINEEGLKKNESNRKDCNFPNTFGCDRFVVFDKNIVNENSIKTYITLCKKDLYEGQYYDKCEIGMIMAGYEIKG